ncbi:MFS transporter [Streptomyces sp. UH6]|uniref:MFS transporter n=1 Tax=Streptomyces sp. UH6 TaxID=2748379 RepID=UPI0015D4E1C3|nr:MFS transporter [Streptomyces sp. UH6]NYV75851.1 MFS transporter [Streptomyces sp. UH6]
MKVKAVPARTSLVSTPQRKIMLAVLLVDTIAAGAFYPLTFLYVRLSTDLPVTRIGLILTCGGLIALLLNPLAGSIADRWGAQRTIVAANACCGIGYLGLVDIHGWPQLVVAVAFITLSQRLYWVGWPVFVAEQAAEGETLDRWFAVVNAFKSGALGLGAALAAVALSVGDVATLRAILLAAVVASFLSAVVFARLRMTPPSPSGKDGAGGGSGGADGAGEGSGGVDGAGEGSGGAGEASPGGTGWLAVLRDRPYTAMTAAHTALTFAWLLPSVALPVYLVDTLSLPPWVPSVAFAMNTVLPVLFQTTVSRMLMPLRRTRAVLVGAGFFVLAFALFAGAHDAPLTFALLCTAAGMVLFSLGEMAAGPAAQALSMDAAPVPLRGRYSSVFQMSWTVSNVAGPAVVGALLGWNGLALWLVLGLLIGVGGLGFVACEKRFPARVLRPEPNGSIR